MTMIGFKRMTIGIHDKATNTIPKSDVYVIEGNAGASGTVSAKISGLSAEPVKVYASDILYHVAQKGIGDVEVEFEVMDMLTALNDKILGYKKNNEFTFIGEDTEPPCVTVILESQTLSGETALLSILNGKFSMDSIELETKEGSNVVPKPTGYTLTALSSDKAGDLKGQVIAKYIGSTMVEEFKTLVMPTVPAV